MASMCHPQKSLLRTLCLKRKLILHEERQSEALFTWGKLGEGDEDQQYRHLGAQRRHGGGSVWASLPVKEQEVFDPAVHLQWQTRDQHAWPKGAKWSGLAWLRAYKAVGCVIWEGLKAGNTRRMCFLASREVLLCRCLYISETRTPT